MLPHFEGAFTLAVMDRHGLVGVRDPHGFRPLCLGRLEHGWVIASETAALDIVGAQFVREIEPGEMLVIDDTGPRSVRPFPPSVSRLCLFEFVYFARPDSTLYGQSVHTVRQRAGRGLAEQAPADADVVVPVPESGIPAAQGYAAVSGIPYSDGLVKNRYVGRTFIEPAQSMRDRGIHMKLNPMPAGPRRQAGRPRRRFDRAWLDDTPTGSDGPRCGGNRSPPSYLLAAVPVAVLLWDGHG